MKPSVVRMLVGVGISVLLAVGAGPAGAAITSIMPSDGSTFTGASQPFSWTGTDVLEYWMYVGRSVGEKDIYNSGSLGTATSTTVTGLPTDGGTVYVRLWNREAAGWLFTDFTYTAFTDGGGGGSAGNSTLRWDRILDSTNGDTNGCNSDRFKCIFGGEAVVDLETGLVWERSPTTSIHTWNSAISHCARLEVGGRKGWHLPMLEQLTSLLPLRTPDLNTPNGPFIHVKSPDFFQSADYWSATAAASGPEYVWIVHFDSGRVDNTGHVEVPHHSRPWCVRGGQAFDGNTHNTLH